jgi:hypothetical protein
MKPVYKRLSKKQLKHVADCYDGPPSKITIARIKSCLEYQNTTKCICYDCRDIARTLNIPLEVTP